MKKIIRETDEKRGIIQVTIADERWYVKQVTDPATKLPALRYVPSVTWIAGHYPKGIAFMKWLADKGWDESQAIKAAAGEKGSKVHEAISAILRGEEVRIDSKFVNPSTEQLEELTLEECDAIKSFVDWRASLKEPMTPIAWDVTVFSEKYGYAGTIDLICKIGEQVYIIDFKTSAQVWSEYELQVSAYKQPLESGEFHIEGFTECADIKLAILQVGYKLNKAGFKWNEVEDKFPLFLAARQIWANECEGQAPKMREYPIVLSPAVSVDEALAADLKEAAPVEEAKPLPMKKPAKAR